MSKIRFPFFPAIPGFSKLYELNLRTYVRVNNTPAVYFLTLDSNHLPGVLVARLAFSLPYRWRSMTLKRDNEHYHFTSQSFAVDAKISSKDVRSDFDLWATERYALVTKRFSQNRQGLVQHRPWSLKKVDIIKLQDNFSKEFLPLKQFLGASFASSLDVRFRPFTSLS